MYGYPKSIKTRFDAEHLATYLNSNWATPENVQRGLSYLRGLRDNTQHYVFDRALAEGEEPGGSEPGFRVMTDDETAERSQFVLTDNPNAPIHKLGFSVPEVRAMIDEIEGEL